MTVDEMVNKIQDTIPKFSPWYVVGYLRSHFSAHDVMTKEEFERMVEGWFEVNFREEGVKDGNVEGA